MGYLSASDVTTVLLLQSSQCPNSRILTSDGKEVFCRFPANKHNLPEGNVILKLGKVGVKRGSQRIGAYGLRHIFEKHRRDLKLKNAEDAVMFVEKVLTKGSRVFIDRLKSDKPIVISASIGLVILEPKIVRGQEACYSVVTAYARKAHPGVLIAKVQ